MSDNQGDFEALRQRAVPPMKRLAIFASVVLFGLPCWCNVRAQGIPWKKNSTDGLFQISDNFKWGYIDSAGKIVIPPQFDEAKDFSEGLAAVKVCTKYGYIDTSGKMIIEPQFQFAEPFSDGLAQVRLSTNEVAYVDRSRLRLLKRVRRSGRFQKGWPRPAGASLTRRDTM